jgi:hypothetical protein
VVVGGASPSVGCSKDIDKLLEDVIWNNDDNDYADTDITAAATATTTTTTTTTTATITTTTATSSTTYCNSKTLFIFLSL